jgi:hypothetical protein
MSGDAPVCHNTTSRSEKGQIYFLADVRGRVGKVKCLYRVAVLVMSVDR